MGSAGLPIEPAAGIAFVPTPLHRLDRLSAELGREVWIKRDDMTGLALGGNKARKLAYLGAEALADGNDTLITAGAAQSNHARMTAAAARILGLDCHLALAGPEDASGNVLLDHMLGASIHWVSGSSWELLMAKVDEIAEQLVARGASPMAIPLGGATPSGCLGYADAFGEITDQSSDAGLKFDRIVFASGTGGTHAGLLVGSALTRRGQRAAEHGAEPTERAQEPAPAERGAPGALHSVAVAQPEELPELVASLATRTAARCDIDSTIDSTWSAGDIRVDCRYWGGTYGEPTEGGVDAIGLFAELEGILLDPVYTGKAAHALINMCRRDEISRDEAILFLHTGGAPALFSSAYSVLFA